MARNAGGDTQGGRPREPRPPRDVPIEVEDDGPAPTLAELAAEARRTVGALLSVIKTGRMPRGLGSAQSLCMALIDAEQRQQALDSKQPMAMQLTLMAGSSAVTTTLEQDREKARLQLRQARMHALPTGDDDGLEAQEER